MSAHDLRQLTDTLMSADNAGGPGMAYLAAEEDAAIIPMSAGRCLVSSVDFFPPLVDDAFDYGRIAATNALSDLYACGATPLFGLAIAGFPRSMAAATILRIHEGATAVLAAAGAHLAGGHTINLAEPIFGLAVTGTAATQAVWRKRSARPGEQILLSKPLGIGVLLNRGLEADIDLAIATMLLSNRDAATALAQHGDSVGAVTDVTGYGLIGHAAEIAKASRCTLGIDVASVPLLAGAKAAAEAGFATSADVSNRTTCAPVTSETASNSTRDTLLYDPQTSGGLLVTVGAHVVDALCQDGFVRIGEVSVGPPAVNLT